MSKKPKQEKQYDDEMPSLKDEFKNQFKRKKETQQEAKQRRQRIRELQEDQYWN
jgi:hypothetical protein